MQCGGSFIRRGSDCSALDVIDDFPPSRDLSQLLPKIDYSANISSYLLLLLQVTYFKCGGVVLGVGLHHILADGASTLNFLNTWASITRGVTPISPLHNWNLLWACLPPCPTFHHVEYDPSPSSKEGNKKNTGLSSSIAILKITLEQLEILKAISRKGGKTSKNYSTYEVLAAHIWRCMCKARGLANDQKTKLYMPVDGRSKLNPPLQSGYFGNAIFHATSTALSGDLRSETLTNTIERVHKAVRLMDGEYLRSAIDYIEMQPDLSSLTRGGHTYKCPNLNINKWSRLPIKEADFGWGSPAFMGLARVLLEGMIFLLPNTSNDGSSWLCFFIHSTFAALPVVSL